MTKYKFIILSNQPFDFELKTNKWHVANVLARRGHDVIYVDPPLRFKALKNFLKSPSFNPAKLFTKAEMKNANLYVYKPANLFNFWPFSTFNTWLHAKKINELIDGLKSDDKVVLWIYHFDYPDLENFITKMKFDLMIYDVVDEYSEFPEYARRKKTNKGLIAGIQWLDDELKILLNQNGLAGVDWVIHREKWLAEKSDLVFASAPGLVTKFKKWRNDVHFLPNAADATKFDFERASLPEPDDLKDIPHPRVGFTGAIDTYKNNIPLIEKCAKELSGFQFVMIGPEKVADPDLDLTKLKSMRNVHFLGLKPWEETPAYFNNFDIFFIPYNLNKAMVEGCFPIKYFEALAAGLPTVVTNMPAYHGFDPDGYVSKSDDEFVENIRRALKEDNRERQDKRKDLARHNSWDGKVDKQLRLIASEIS